MILAAALRLFSIDRIPPALNWDEAAIGWNAKTIWKMHLDEFGTRWPISFRSFGDYKSPLYIYLTAPVVGILGSSEVSVRLVSAAAGIVSVGLMYFLGGTAAALLMAITPWHILLSRPALEANLALMFVLGGIWLFLEAAKRPVLLILSALSFILSLYSYQAPKIFVPIFVLGLMVIYWSSFKRALFWLVITGIITAVAVAPLVKDGLGAGGRRFTMTSVFYKQKVNLPVTLVKNYLVHFSPRWLFWSGGESNRSQMKETGMLLLVEAPLIILGLVELFKRRREKWSQVIIWWILAAPLPAMIGFDAPHAIRALQLLPALILVTALGFDQIRRRKIWLWLLVFINAGYFIYHYFNTYPIETARDWQYGYKEAATVASEWEDQVDKIIITVKAPSIRSHAGSCSGGAVCPIMSIDGRVIGIPM
jgi:4-amino-4-deoxy-L-arabinose transferase-like glycosyltransferase